MGVPLQEANMLGKHGSTYLYDERHSRRSSRSSQDLSMADIVNILFLTFGAIYLRLCQKFEFSRA